MHNLYLGETITGEVAQLRNKDLGASRKITLATY